MSDKPEHRSLTPRPGWTQEQEYIALSEEFFEVEENRDRLAEQLRKAKEDAKDAGEASIQAAFWRMRAIELGASEGEYREFVAREREQA